MFVILEQNFRSIFRCGCLKLFIEPVKIFKHIPFFKILLERERESKRAGAGVRGRGRWRRRNRLPGEQGARCGAPPQNPGTISQAKGRCLTD